MASKWKIIKKDEQARNEHKICCYCKRFYCTKYHKPRNRMVCSGVLPQWDFLYRLMRDVCPTDTCQKFDFHKLHKARLKQKQRS